MRYLALVSHEFAIEPQIMAKEAAFEHLLPQRLRRASRQFWTPGAVAALGARWLIAEGAQHVLDVGSGVGKFCTLAALSSSLRFAGVEHREELVYVAEHAARTLRASKVTFFHKNFRELDLDPYDALYFYHPFNENFFMRWEQLDQAVPLEPSRFDHEIAYAERVLKEMPVGSFLLTYLRFGGRIPGGYSLLRAARYGRCTLRLWKKESAELGHTYWVEENDRVCRRGVAISDR